MFLSVGFLGLFYGHDMISFVALNGNLLDIVLQFRESKGMTTIKFRPHSGEVLTGNFGYILIKVSDYSS